MDNNENENFAPEYRDRLRTWLVKMIDSGTVPGLCWENDEKTVFRMPWKHAGRQDYNLEEDSKIFMAWAKHSGRYREGIDKPEPIVWKTRLRCALNKMPDIKELPSRSRLDISEPYRVYQLLPPVHKASQIRKRYYNRSQSHDTNSIKNVEHTNKSSRDHGMFNETAASHSGTSPVLTGAPAVPTPGFWYQNSVKVPLTVPMSSTGNQAVNTSNPLQSLSQARYPLVTTLHPSLMSFPSSNISPFFSTPASNLEALKQLGLTNQASMSEYIHQLTARALEDHYQGNRKNFAQSTDDKASPDSHDVTEESFNRNEYKYAKIESDSKIGKAFSDSNVAPKPFGDNHTVQLQSLYARLSESQQRIENLEKDLKKSRTAHAREREAREKLELEKIKLKARLENMNAGLRALASYIPRQDEKHFINAIFNNKSNFSETNPTINQLSISCNDIRASSLSPVKNEYFVDEKSSQAPPQYHRALSSVETNRRSPVQFQDKPINELKNNNANRKRSASPLDLTVNSPKKPRPGDENTNPELSIKNSLLSNNGVYLTSSPTRSLSSEDKRIQSPFSSVSGSPDSISRSRSLSPQTDRCNILPQYQSHHGTIQVS